MLQKLLLILALHGSGNFDAWTTNQWVPGPPGYPACYELNPFYRPFAGTRKMYIAVNLAMIPYDIWLLSGRKPRAARAVALAMTGWQLSLAARNVHKVRERDGVLDAARQKLAEEAEWRSRVRKMMEGVS